MRMERSFSVNGIRKPVFAVAAVVALTLAVPQAIAVLSGQRANLGAQRMVTVTQDSAQENDCGSAAGCAQTFTQLPGASTTITVPSGQTARLIARFSGESRCTVSWCSLRIVVDGTEMLPASGINFAFDSGDGADDRFEGLAMDRTSKVLSAGTHTVKVEWALGGNNSSFWLDDWQLTVEEWRVS